MDILSQLFGSEIKVLLLRLFLENPNELFSLADIAGRLKADKRRILPHIHIFSRISLIRSGRKTETEILGKKKLKKKVSAFGLNNLFPYLQALKTLVLAVPAITPQDIFNKLKETGSLKLVVLAGLFINNTSASAVDLLIVGERLNKKKIAASIRDIESRLTKNINYTFFSTKEFLYRRNMADKFLTDILEFPHLKVFDKLVSGA